MQKEKESQTELLIGKKRRSDFPDPEKEKNDSRIDIIIDPELLLQAMSGDPQANLLLAERIWKSSDTAVYRELCRLFLTKAIELGNEESFFIYQRLFREEIMEMDEQTYQDILNDYQKTEDIQKKEVLLRYLKLRQKTVK